MYREVAILDKNLSYNEIQNALFEGLKYKLHGFCCHTEYIPEICKLVPEGIVLSTVIDYPMGMSDTDIRNHAIISAIRRGVNAIDLVAHTSKNIEKFTNDLISNLAICKDKNVTLRLMFEYRDTDPLLLLEMASISSEVGIEYIFPSTGYRVDNYIDNILSGKAIQEVTKQNVITNGNIWLKKHLENIENSKVFGMRLHSVLNLKTLFGV